MGTSRQEARIRALELAGLLGGSFPSTLLTTVLGNDEGLLALMDDGTLVETGTAGQVRLVGEETALEAANKLTRSRKRVLWRALAEASQALHLPHERTAAFFESAARLSSARSHWIRAAEHACELQSYPDALSWIRQALAIWPWTEAPQDRVRILREMARCAANAGDSANARQAWQELADYAQDAGLVKLRIEALGQLAGFSDDAARATSLYKEAAELAEAHLPPARAIRAMLDYVDNLANRVRLGMAREFIERVVRTGEASGSKAILSEVRGWQGLIAAMSGDHAAAQDWVEESLKLAIKHDLPEMAALAYRRRGNIADYAGNYSGEATAHAEAIHYCRQSQVGDQMSCLSCMAYACYRTGDWKAALRSTRAVLEDPKAHAALKGIAECVEGLIYAFRGQRKTAGQKLEHSLHRIRMDGILGMEFFGMMGQAFIQNLNGNTEEATRIFDDVRSLWRETDDVHDVVPAMLFAGGHYAREGHAGRLADCIDILTTILRKNPLDEFKAALTALKGEQALLKEDTPAFIEAMDAASTLFEKCNLPLEQVWTGIKTRAAGGARRDPSRLSAIIKRLGLRPFSAMLEERSPGAQADGCDLTPRQREVLNLLVEGLTSKEMANRLFLSTRTVEMHVGRLLERLNCRTRPEAVSRAAERGWIGGAGRPATRG